MVNYMHDDSDKMINIKTNYKICIYLYSDIHTSIIQIYAPISYNYNVTFIQT